MANPTAEKTWQFDLNNVVVADSTLDGLNAFRDRRELLLGIKDALIGLASNPWSVVSSSDSSTSSASDLWVDAGDLRWRDDDTSGVFSWIVLRQTGISTTFELLITCEEDSIGVDGARIGAWVAQAGFTGGTTTARPTATDERQLRDSTSSGWWGSGADGVSYDFRYHVMQSSDGECTRVLIFINGTNTGFWLFDKPKNPVTGWSDPYVAVISGNNDASTNQTTYAKFYDSANGLGRFSGIETTMYLSGEGFLNAAAGELVTVPNELTGDFVASEVGLHSLSSTFVGRVGELFDLWWGYSFADTGRYYEGTAAKEFVQVSDMVFPWDGSTIIGTR